MAKEGSEEIGLREHKRQETAARIIEAGMKLFIKDGFEETSIEAIAEASGISRRTFFHYFKSKEDILLARQDGGFRQSLRTAILNCSPDQSPFKAVRDCLLKLATIEETKDSIVVDRIMQSTPALSARKQARFIEIENTLFEAMIELWSNSSQVNDMSIISMVSIGLLRLALEDWRQNKAKQPIFIILSSGLRA